MALPNNRKIFDMGRARIVEEPIDYVWTRYLEWLLLVEVSHDVQQGEMLIASPENPDEVEPYHTQEPSLASQSHAEFDNRRLAVLSAANFAAVRANLARAMLVDNAEPTYAEMDIDGMTMDDIGAWLNKEAEWLSRNP